MKFVLTGSLGNISKPLVEELIEKGHTVTLISSNPERVKAIEEIRAIPAIGTMEDVDFLTESFTGADAVYCMIPPGDYFDQDFDQIEFYKQVGNNYAEAILKSNVKKVIYLSSIGGNMNKDNGQLIAHTNVENIFKSLPEEIKITTLRPTSFYYNLFGFIPAIKSQGIIASNYGEDDKCPWVSPSDIAEVVAEELEGSFSERKVRYIVSEELTCNEIAKTLGEAIGKPDLKWILISDGDMLNGALSIGLNPKIAEGLTEMHKSIHNGKLLEDYYSNKPKFEKVKLKDFAKEFAKVYNQ
ncbi:NAD(P)H-binding protein [uncultured Aquimarina sp.]|uniref:SDR family oxidoreductase n=1 Tax=uncultured Aquimarina sp. TaxID=575652 RepID=UPI0026061952|nr:NAD(P)H-binding protein [uncultured Aquimarina sp.]